MRPLHRATWNKDAYAGLEGKSAVREPPTQLDWDDVDILGAAPNQAGSSGRGRNRHHLPRYQQDCVVCGAQERPPRNPHEALIVDPVIKLGFSARSDTGPSNKSL